MAGVRLWVRRECAARVALGLLITVVGGLDLASSLPIGWRASGLPVAEALRTE